MNRPDPDRLATGHPSVYEEMVKQSGVYELELVELLRVVLAVFTEAEWSQTPERLLLREKIQRRVGK